jgi:poly(hydroxyalkanoate) depolymerase family esterase
MKAPMSPEFRRLMTESLRLTRSGDLQGAARVLQQALHGGGRAADLGEIIDIEAREAGSAAPAPAAHPGEFIAGRYTDAHGTRDHKLYVPPAPPGRALPLVVMLHGCTQDPDDFALGTGMNEAARRHGFYVLYPAQTQHANTAGCWNWFKHNHQQRGRGEPALLEGMTRDILQRHAVDPRRVFVAGLSAGGAMAAILGDAYPDRFAAVGVHSGLPAGAASDVKTAFAAMQSGATARPSGRTPPTIVFHGDRDDTVHPRNGEQVVAASAGAAQPEQQRGRSPQGRDYTRRVYRGDAGHAVAEHWTVHGAGHAWSGGRPGASYTDPAGPDATAEMLRFFFANPLRHAG